MIRKKTRLITKQKKLFTWSYPINTSTSKTLCIRTRYRASTQIPNNFVTTDCCNSNSWGSCFSFSFTIFQMTTRFSRVFLFLKEKITIILSCRKIFSELNLWPRWSWWANSMWNSTAARWEYCWRCDCAWIWRNKSNEKWGIATFSNLSRSFNAHQIEFSRQQAGNWLDLQQKKKIYPLSQWMTMTCWKLR